MLIGLFIDKIMKVIIRYAKRAIYRLIKGKALLCVLIGQLIDPSGEDFGAKHVFNA